jgi:hypothetical protein
MLASFPRQGIATFPGYQHKFKLPCSERTARMQGLSAYEHEPHRLVIGDPFPSVTSHRGVYIRLLGTFLWCLGRVYTACCSLQFFIQSAVSLECARRFLGTNMLSLLWFVIWLRAFLSFQRCILTRAFSVGFTNLTTPVCFSSLR